MRDEERRELERLASTGDKNAIQDYQLMLVRDNDPLGTMLLAMKLCEIKNRKYLLSALRLDFNRGDGPRDAKGELLKEQFLGPHQFSYNLLSFRQLQFQITCPLCAKKFAVSRFVRHGVAHVKSGHFPKWMAKGSRPKGKIINLLPDPK